MEIFQIDKNYTNFLIRTVDKEIKNNKFDNKQELLNYINWMRDELSKKEVIDYINNNKLVFDMQDFNKKILGVIDYYDRLSGVQLISPIPNTVNNNTVNSVNNDNMKFLPITSIDASVMNDQLLAKINYLIVSGLSRDYEVNLEKQIFRNIKDNQFYDVIKNENTNAYELSNLSSPNKNTKEDVTKNKEDKKKTDKNKIKLVKQDNLSVKKEPKAKTRSLNKIMPVINNKAFASTVLIASISAASGILIAALFLAH